MSERAQDSAPGEPGLMRLAMWVLWPAFLAAALAEACFFSWFAPEQLSTLAPQAVYSIGFFFFWVFCTLASLVTGYLIRVPEGEQPRF
jgi:polyferredoxin